MKPALAALVAPKVHTYVLASASAAATPAENEHENGAMAAVLYVAVSGEDKIKCYFAADLTAPPLETDAPGPFQLCTSPDCRFLFAVGMGPDNEHVSFAVDPSSGALTHICTVIGPVPEGDGCYISIDATGRFLFTSYYGGACVSVLPVSADGVIGEHPLQVLPTTRGCHSIRAHPSNRYAYLLQGTNASQNPSIYSRTTVFVYFVTYIFPGAGMPPVLQLENLTRGTRCFRIRWTHQTQRTQPP